MNGDITTAMATAAQITTAAEQASLIVEGLTCTTEAEYQHVGVVLKACKAEIKRIEEKRKSFTTPLLDLKRKLDAEFKPAKVILEACEKQLKKKVVDYQALIEAQQQVVVDQMQVAHQQGNFNAAIQLSQSVPEVGKVDGVSVNMVWKYRVVDANLVPRELLAVDDRAVREALKAGHRQIAGLEIYEEPQVRSTSK